MKKIIVVCILLLLIILAFGLPVFKQLITKDESTALLLSPEIMPASTPLPTAETIISTPQIIPTVEPTPTIEAYTDIIIGATGDIICHIQQINGAKTAGKGDGYSFYEWFDYIKPALQYPDLMIANLEGPIAGEDEEYNGYPMFNFPDEIIPAIKDAGIDVLLNGNNHIMDQKIQGIENTIDMLDAAGVSHTGAWKSLESRQIPLVIDVEGIKVGIISATYSLNGFEQHLSPQELKYLVCYIDTKQIEAQINLCREYGAEFIIVSPHMGDEFVKHPRRGIRAYAEEYIRLGADIVFGHHPHVLQQVDSIEVEAEDGTTKNGIIFYSLGNFISSMYGVSKEAGCIAYVEIRRNNATREITIKNVEYLPTWTYRHGKNNEVFNILPVGTSLDYPEKLKPLEISKGAVYRLRAVWDATIETLDNKVATPLRYIPKAANTIEN